MPERRVNSRMLLVGSLPAESAEHAFRAGAELFGDMVFSLPTGKPVRWPAGSASSASA